MQSNRKRYIAVITQSATSQWIESKREKENRASNNAFKEKITNNCWFGAQDQVNNLAQATQQKRREKTIEKTWKLYKFP